MWQLKKAKTYLFIDGSNLYAGQYELFGPGKYLDFAEFIKQIGGILQVKFNKIYFYASYSPKSKKPTRKQKLYLKNEALFYRSVKQTKNTIFFKGYRSKTSGKEKEVDVKLAVDIVNFAHKNKFESMYLLSGDADFMHALNIAKDLNKKISILALQNRIPRRFVYAYKTFVFVFGKKESIKVLSKQKIQVRHLSEDFLIKSAIK